MNLQQPFLFFIDFLNRFGFPAQSGMWIRENVHRYSGRNRKGSVQKGIIGPSVRTVEPLPSVDRLSGRFDELGHDLDGTAINHSNC